MRIKQLEQAFGMNTDMPDVELSTDDDILKAIHHYAEEYKSIQESYWNDALHEIDINVAVFGHRDMQKDDFYMGKKSGLVLSKAILTANKQRR